MSLFTADGLQENRLPVTRENLSGRQKEIDRLNLWEGDKYSSDSGGIGILF
ncbi:MAG: hypothetical protein ACLTNW_17580 [Mediterraneibacter gnavus]